jgi:hypothetical protein
LAEPVAQPSGHQRLNIGQVDHRWKSPLMLLQLLA